VVHLKALATLEAAGWDLLIRAAWSGWNEPAQQREKQFPGDVTSSEEQVPWHWPRELPPRATLCNALEARLADGHRQ